MALVSGLDLLEVTALRQGQRCSLGMGGVVPVLRHHGTRLGTSAILGDVSQPQVPLQGDSNQLQVPP